MKKRRWLYTVLILVTIPLGLGTRWYRSDLPSLIAEYGGDVLSATCITFGVRFLALRSSWIKVLFISYVICIAIETSQLYRAPWLVHLRDDTPVGILLGHSFSWSDLVCYAVGVLIAFLIGHGLEKLAPISR